MTDEAVEPYSIEIGRIMELIPHRYPFLLVDRLEEVRLGTSAVGIKNVTINEPFFPGHFPGAPVMPGVILIESMAQTAAVLVVETMGPEMEGNLVYFMSVENARFRRPVGPGDQLRIEVARRHSRGRVWKFEGVCKVGGAVVAEAIYTAMITEREG